MSRTRTLSRRLLPIVGLATLALGVVVGGLVWQRHAARVKALALLGRRVPHILFLSDDDRGRVERALAICPGLEEGEAALAALAACEGDLARAHELIERAGDAGEWARRARAWLAFREGAPREACALLERTRFSEDLDWITFASGQPIAWRSDLAESVRNQYEDVARIRAWFTGFVKSLPASDYAQLGRRVLARIETVELHDAAADALLHDADLQLPAFDRTVAALARAEVAAIRSGSDTGVEPWVSSPAFRLTDALALLDEKLAERACIAARIDLERYQHFGRDADLVRAIERVRRALALSRRPRSAPSADCLLARARGYEIGGRDVEARRALATRFETANESGRRLEAMRILISLDQQAEARASWEAQHFQAGRDGGTDPILSFELEALWAGPGSNECARFWLSDGHDAVCGPEDEAAAATALRSLIVGRPWEARPFLERCRNVHPTVLSLAVAREDPVRALALFAPRSSDSDDATVRAFAAVLDDEPVALAKKLQAAGLSGAKAQEVAGVVEAARSELKKDGLLD